MVAVVFRWVVRVLIVEGGISGRPVHHLLSIHHIAHGSVRTIRTTGPCMRRKNCLGGSHTVLGLQHL